MNKVSNIINNKNFRIVAVIVILFSFVFSLSKSISNSNKELVIVNNRLDRKNFQIYKQKDDKSGYELYNGSGFPEGQKLNTSLTVCVDTNNNTVENIFTYSDGKFSVTSNKTVFCTLYFDLINSLAKEFTTENPYIREYTGQGWVGGDSATKFFDNHIYYWYVPSSSYNGHTVAENVAIVKDSWNVVFAGHCWQIIRTTDNGGVKLLYNGEPIVGTDLQGNTTYDCSEIREEYRLTEMESYVNYFYGTRTYADNYTSTTNGTTTTFTLYNNDGSTPVSKYFNNSNMSELIGKYSCEYSNTSCTNTSFVKVIRSDDNYSAYVIKPTYSNSIGQSTYNIDGSSPAYLGYMYNYLGEKINKTLVSQENTLNDASSTTLNSTSLGWYFSDSYVSGTSARSDCYASSNSNVEGNATCYALGGTPALGSTIVDPTNSGTPDYSYLVGKYTLKSNSATYGNNSIVSSLYYVVGYDGSTLYMTRLTHNHPLSYYQKTYYLSQTYENGALQNPVQIKNFATQSDLQNSSNSWQTTWPMVSSIYNNQGYYMCIGTNVCTSWLISGAGWSNMTYFDTGNVYYFSNTYTYNSSTGKYTVHMDDDPDVNLRDSDAIRIWNFTNNSEYDKVGKAHYVCLRDSDYDWDPGKTECSYIGYVYYIGSNPISTEYMVLSGGQYLSTDESNTATFENSNNVLYSMLYGNNVNVNDSILKSKIDKWYEDDILNTPAESKIDTEEIFCNDRSTSNDYGSMNLNNNAMRWYLQLGGIGRNNTIYYINCPRKTDAFSKDETLKGNGDLTYPVGLISYPEIANLGYKDLISTKSYWLGTPYNTGFNNATLRIVLPSGLSSTFPYSELGVRPSVALKSTAEYTRGDGSMTDPYVVE